MPRHVVNGWPSTRRCKDYRHFGKFPNGNCAHAVFQEILADSISSLERLVLLSSERDPGSGCYRHAELIKHFGKREICTALRAWHEQAFSEWLCLTLEQQFHDLKLYFSTVDRFERGIQTWRDLDTRLQLMPAYALKGERALFLSDFHILLSLLDRDDGLSHGTTPPSLDSRVARVVHLADQLNGRASLSLRAIAPEVHTSEKHLGALFKGLVGLPFREFLRRVRMKRAAAMLSDLSSPIKEVAAAAGYGDLANFYRDFKCFFGCTPAEYRVHCTGSDPSRLASRWLRRRL